MQDTQARIEPTPAVLDAARRWLTPVRAALDADFVSAYLTGSVLNTGFDAERSHINLLIVSRTLDTALLDRLAPSIPKTRKAPHFEPLFMTREQMSASLDVFPIEWLDIVERHMRLEGDDVFTGIEVPRTYLRLQCEHELRGKLIRLRQEYLASTGNPARLAEVLARLASGFNTLFRTLLRLRGEETPASTERVIERLADAYGLDARALLGAHLLRHAGKRPADAAVRDMYRAFLTEIDRLIGAIDGLRLT